MVTAAGLAAFAVFVWLGPRPDVGRLVDLPHAGDRRRRRGWAVAVGMVATITGVWLIAGPRISSVVTIIAMVIATSTWLIRQGWLRRTRRRRSRDVTGACLVVLAEVRAGRHVQEALDVAAADFDVIAPVAARVAVGASIPGELRRCGAQPGAEGLVELARAWEVSERTGAQVSATLEVIVEQLRSAEELAATVAAELAAPRATAKLLAFLPLAGVAVGTAVGADPITFLVGTTIGNVVAMVGIGLACGGVVWSEVLGGRQ